MAVAFRSASTAGNTGTGTSVAVPVPSGAATDDIAILCLYIEADPGTITWPTGFTQFINNLQTRPNPDFNTYVAWKRLTGADTGNYTISFQTATWRSAGCCLYTGVRTTGNPYDTDIGNTAGGAAGVTITAPAVVPTNDETMTVCVSGTFDDKTFTHSTGLTERFDFHNVALGDESGPYPRQSTGTNTITASAGNTEWTGSTFSLVSAVQGEWAMDSTLKKGLSPLYRM